MILKASSTGNSQDPNLQAWQYNPTRAIECLRGGSVYDRYPKEGWAQDNGGEKVILVWEGRCKVVIDDTAHDVIPGDVVVIPKGAKFFIDAPFEKSVKCWILNEGNFNEEQINYLPI